MVSSQSGVSDAPNPGCSGTITSNLSASDRMNGSQAPAPLAPCRIMSGGPAPPPLCLMLQPLPAIVDVVWPAILPHLLAEPAFQRPASYIASERLQIAAGASIMNQAFS